MSIEQQISEKFGEIWLHIGNEYKVTCPTCNHKSLWLNVSKMCFVCFACQPNSSGHLSMLLRIPGHTRLTGAVEKLRSTPPDISPHFSLKSGKLPKGYMAIERRSDFPKGWDYVLGRGVDPAQTEFGKYNNTHVCFPMREDGEIVYWQSRALSRAVKMKTENPYNDEDTRGKSTVVYQVDKVKRGEPVVVVEGVFDALRSGGVATLGKKPSFDQITRILKRRPSLVVFCYDGDAYDASLAGCGMVKKLKRLQPTLAVQLPEDKDPADLGRQALIDLVSSTLSRDVPCQTLLRLSGSSVERISTQLQG